MNYKVEATSGFDRQIKHLLKKYPSLKSEYDSLINSLEVNPNLGKSIGNNCFKIRLAIASKGKGKSGGARVITYVKILQNKVYLLTIYDKSEQSDISPKELKDLISSLP